jgi:hypothetical protein
MEPRNKEEPPIGNPSSACRSPPSGNPLEEPLWPLLSIIDGPFPFLTLFGLIENLVTVVFSTSTMAFPRPGGHRRVGTAGRARTADKCTISLSSEDFRYVPNQWNSGGKESLFCKTFGLWPKVLRVGFLKYEIMKIFSLCEKDLCRMIKTF